MTNHIGICTKAEKRRTNYKKEETKKQTAI